MTNGLPSCVACIMVILPGESVSKTTVDGHSRWPWSFVQLAVTERAGHPDRRAPGTRLRTSLVRPLPEAHPVAARDPRGHEPWILQRRKGPEPPADPKAGGGRVSGGEGW